MLLSSARKAQIQCFWQPLNSRQLCQGEGNGISPIEHGCDNPVSQPSSSCCVQQSLSKTSYCLSGILNLPLSLSGYVLRTAAEILRVWCEDLVKSMQELCSLGMPLCINLTSAVSLQHAPSLLWAFQSEVDGLHPAWKILLMLSSKSQHCSPSPWHLFLSENLSKRAGW